MPCSTCKWWARWSEGHYGLTAEEANEHGTCRLALGPQHRAIGLLGMERVWVPWPTPAEDVAVVTSNPEVSDLIDEGAAIEPGFWVEGAGDNWATLCTHQDFGCSCHEDAP